MKVASPVSFIFHSRWFGSSRLEDSLFPQVCEIINSCIVPFLPDLVFHPPSTPISEYCRRPNLQLTHVYRVNSAMKSILLTEIASATTRPASTTMMGLSCKSKIRNPIEPEAMSVYQKRVLASVQLTQTLLTSQNPEAVVYSSSNCSTTTTPERARLC